MDKSKTDIRKLPKVDWPRGMYKKWRRIEFEYLEYEIRQVDREIQKLS